MNVEEMKQYVHRQKLGQAFCIFSISGYSNLNGRSYKLEKYQKKLNVRFVVGDMNSRLRN